MTFFQILLCMLSIGSIAYAVYLIYELVIIILLVAVGKDGLKESIKHSGHYLFFTASPWYAIILCIAGIAAGAYNLVVNFKMTILKILSICTYADILILFLSIFSLIVDIRYKCHLRRVVWEKPDPNYKTLEDRFIDYFFGGNYYKSIITAIMILAGIINAIFFGINIPYID